MGRRASHAHDTPPRGVRQRSRNPAWDRRLFLSGALPLFGSALFLFRRAAVGAHLALVALHFLLVGAQLLLVLLQLGAVSFGGALGGRRAAQGDQCSDGGDEQDSYSHVVASRPYHSKGGARRKRKRPGVLRRAGPYPRLNRVTWSGWWWPCLAPSLLSSALWPPSGRPSAWPCRTSSCPCRP